MNKSKQQGTAHESRVASRIRAAGIPSDRLPEGGALDRGDVWAVSQPDAAEADHVALWWKRLSKLKEGQTNRRPDGEPEVVVITPDFFLYLLHAWAEYTHGEMGVVIECKATQSLNVTRVLHKARVKLSDWKRSQGTN
tara:strand:+ start:629 stop:1042 length:414 start_codon:yes stop_codon:yes gene_type:complete